MNHGISEKLHNELAEYLKVSRNRFSRPVHVYGDDLTAAVYFLLRKIEELQTRVDELESTREKENK